MTNFAQQVDRLLEEINGEIQELNNENPVESILHVCSGCDALLREDDYLEHECSSGTLQDDPIDPIMTRLILTYYENLMSGVYSDIRTQRVVVLTEVNLDQGADRLPLDAPVYHQLDQDDFEDHADFLTHETLEFC